MLTKIDLNFDACPKVICTYINISILRVLSILPGAQMISHVLSGGLICEMCNG